MRITVDRTTFEPGDTITGQVMHGAPTDAVVSLRWQITSKAEPEEGQVAETSVRIDEMAARFSLTAPDTPISFAGRLFSLAFFVHVSGAGEEDRVGIVVGPGRVVATYPTP